MPLGSTADAKQNFVNFSTNQKPVLRHDLKTRIQNKIDLKEKILFNFLRNLTNTINFENLRIECFFTLKHFEK